jgi:hypothetical protein
MEPTWSLFSGENKVGETQEQTFMRTISKQLHIKLKPNSVCPIYNYSSGDKDMDNFICYAKINKLEQFPNTKNFSYGWFTFKQIQKLHIPEQTRQNITVGQRVIASAIRKGLGQRTIE